MGKFSNDAVVVVDYKVAYTILGSIAIVGMAIGIFVWKYYKGGIQ